MTLDAATLVVVNADDHRISIPWDERRPIEGLRFIREDDREIARPGNLITWAVDRARDLSWFGDERMQLTKAIAYTALDKIDRALGAVHASAVEEPDAEELGGTTNPTAHTDPETGWPPEAIARVDQAAAPRRRAVVPPRSRPLRAHDARACRCRS